MRYQCKSIFVPELRLLLVSERYSRIRILESSDGKKFSGSTLSQAFPLLSRKSITKLA